MPTRAELSQYFQRIDEPELRTVLLNFFEEKIGEAHLLHGTAEHGIDIAVKIPEHRDHINKIHYLLIQVKTGNINSAKWRNDILGQMLEISYYPIRHPAFTEEAPKRLLLMTTGNLDQEVRQSILEFNFRHYIKIEVYELNNLVNLFDLYNYYAPIEPQQALEGTQPPEVREESAPPALGEDQITSTIIRELGEDQ